MSLKHKIIFLLLLPAVLCGQGYTNYWKYQFGAVATVYPWEVRLGGVANYAKFATDGTLSLVGDATVHEDLQVPLTAGKQGATDKPLYIPDSTGFRFIKDSTETITGVAQLPHAYKHGSDVNVHVHYQQTTAATPRFVVEYRWTNIGDSTSTAWQRMAMDSAVGTYSGGQIHRIAYSTVAISGAGKTLSSVIQYKLKRLVDQAATNVIAYTIDFHYERDGLGSRTEYSK